MTELAPRRFVRQSAEDLGQQCVNDKLKLKFKTNVFNTTNPINEYETVYAIGDLHGDYEAMISILVSLGCVIESDETKHGYTWNPACTNVCIVQVGDFTDGFNRIIKHGKVDYSDIEYSEDNKHLGKYSAKVLTIIYQLIYFAKQARKVGSNILMIYGNHEIANLCRTIETIRKQYYSWENEKSREAAINTMQKFKYHILCNCKPYAIINDYMFCHSEANEASIRDLLRKYGTEAILTDSTKTKYEKIDKINECFSREMFSFVNFVDSDKSLYRQDSARVFNREIYSLVDLLSSRQCGMTMLRSIPNASLSPYYQEQMSKFNITYSQGCAANIKFLHDTFDVKGVIIGHSVLPRITELSPVDNCTVIGIDVGLSRSFGTKSNINILMITTSENPLTFANNYTIVPEGTQSGTLPKPYRIILTINPLTKTVNGETLETSDMPVMSTTKLWRSTERN